jgi:hypothetical protein
MSDTKVENPWNYDQRIRARNLKSGALGEKDLSKYLTALPDLEGQVESFAVPQPALDLPPELHVDDLSDDEDDDDDDLDNEEATTTQV